MVDHRDAPLIPAIVYVLLVGHFLADFVAQSDWMALNKSKDFRALWYHVGVYMVVMAAVVRLGAGAVHSAPDGLLAWLAVNMFAHAAQDAITSRITSWLWFIPMAEFAEGREILRTTETVYLARVTPTRHWFFVMIGFDQLLHYVTLLVTAGWWLR